MTITNQEVAHQESPKNTDKELNFLKLREQLEQERAEKLQFAKRLEELEKERANLVKKSSSDDDDDESEPYVDHRRLRKKLEKVTENTRQFAKEDVKQAVQEAMYEERKTSYLKENPDFSDVMQPATIQKFADKNPRVAQAILGMPEGFERQKLVYESIKAMESTFKEEKSSIQAKIDQNKRSPYYQPSGPGNAPYAAVGDYSSAGQKTAYEKMQQLKSNLRM